MNRKFFKIIVLTFVTLFCFFITSKDTFAISCTDNDATQWACKMNAAYNCTSATRCGALWLNGSSSFSSGSTAKIAADGISLGDIGGTITVYLHGAVYNYGSTNPYTSQTAYHIKILTGLPGEGPGGAGTAEPENVSNLVSFMTTEGDSLDRGGSDGTQGTWSSGSSTPLTVKVDVVGLIDSADSVTTNDDGSKTFSKTVYIYRCFRQEQNADKSRGCGANPSTISITFDPECEEYTYTATYKGKTSFDVGQYSSSGSSGDSSNIYSNGSLLTKAGDNGILQNINWEPDGGNKPNIVSGTYYTKMEQGQKFAFKYKMKLDGISPSTPALTTQKPGGSDSNWRNWLKSTWTLNEQTLFSDKTRWKRKTGTASFKTSLNKIIKDYSDRYITTSSGFIPYGTSKTISERFSFNNNGDKYAERKICKVFKGLKHKKNGKIVEKVEVTIDKLTAKDRPDSGNTRKKSTEIGSDITLKNPYNFDTTLTAEVNGLGGSVVYAGQSANLMLSVNINPRVNPVVHNGGNAGYVTKVPGDTEIQGAVFTIDSSLAWTGGAENIKDAGGFAEKNDVAPKDICDYVKGVFINKITGCSMTGLTKDSDAINSSINAGSSSAAQINLSTSRLVPDVPQGTKYCVVLGINHADSHGAPGQPLRADETKGPQYYGANSTALSSDSNPAKTNLNWHISNITCRTVAKAPFFQAWGGVYTSGNINTATITKVPGATLDSTSGTKYLFGSWAETIALANKDISLFSSGAAIGYNYSDQNGGKNASTGETFCSISRLSIANNKCQRIENDTSSFKTGKVGNVVISNKDFIENLNNRFATANSGLSQVSNSIWYAKETGNRTLNDANGILKNYISNGILAVSDKTIVYKVDGKLTITGNVCVGYASSCGSNSSTNYQLANINKSFVAGSTTIPQIILIADDIDIQQDVTEVDAWLIAKNNINTCSNNDMYNADSCSKTLIVNGPVFAQSLQLLRYAGADPGGRSKAIFDANTNILEKASTTPAEIFNLRPDVYQWIYQQTTTEDKAAIVRYIRELAPRY